MNHQYIEDHQVLDRYLMNQLTPDEAVEFEQHYIHCSSCLEQLEVGEKFQHGLRRAAAKDAMQWIFAERLGLLARLGRSRHAGLIAALTVAAVALPIYWAHQNATRAGDEIKETQLAMERLAQQEAEQRQKVEALEAQLAGLPGTASRPRSILEPLANLGIAYLTPVRDASFSDPSPPKVVYPPQNPGSMVLLLEIGDPDYASYRATLSQQGQELDRAGGLTPDERQALPFVLASENLEPGEYVVQVDGTPPGDEPVFVARFTFRLSPGA
ncbi:MAG: hypothetical protein AAF657_09725 [Acidobacteriota bacterium]